MNAHALRVSVTRRWHLAAALLMVISSPCWPSSPSASHWIEHGDEVIEDKLTGLNWTRADNGQDIDWKAAHALCAAKKAGWRLPTADELESIYRIAADSGDSAVCAAEICRMSPLFRLSGTWFWSSSHAGIEKDDGRDLFWGVVMVNGVRTPNLEEFDYSSRVLCVRR